VLTIAKVSVGSVLQSGQNSSPWCHPTRRSRLKPTSWARRWLRACRRSGGAEVRPSRSPSTALATHGAHHQCEQLQCQDDQPIRPAHCRAAAEHRSLLPGARCDRQVALHDVPSAFSLMPGIAVTADIKVASGRCCNICWSAFCRSRRRVCANHDAVRRLPAAPGPDLTRCPSSSPCRNGFAAPQSAAPRVKVAEQGQMKRAFRCLCGRQRLHRRGRVPRRPLLPRRRRRAGQRAQGARWLQRAGTRLYRSPALLATAVHPWHGVDASTLSSAAATSLFNANTAVQPDFAAAEMGPRPPTAGRPTASLAGYI